MPSLSELRAKEADLRRLLAQAKALSRSGGSHADTLRARDRERKREALHASKALLIPRCKDPLRREQLEADATEWPGFYLPHVFTGSIRRADRSQFDQGRRRPGRNR